MPPTSEKRGHRCQVKGCDGFCEVDKTIHDNQQIDSDKNGWTRRTRVCRKCFRIQHTLEITVDVTQKYGTPKKSGGKKKQRKIKQFIQSLFDLAGTEGE